MMTMIFWDYKKTGFQNFEKHKESNKYKITINLKVQRNW